MSNRDSAKEFWAAMVASSEDEPPVPRQVVPAPMVQIGSVSGNVIVMGEIPQNSLDRLLRGERAG